MKVLVFDIGGTSIKHGICVDNQLSSVKETPTDARKGARHVMETVISLIRDTSVRYDAIGISTAGQVNAATGSIIYANQNIPGYTGTQIRQELENLFHVPVMVENDVNAAAMGEAIYGAGKAFDSFLMRTYGTGVGGAVGGVTTLYVGPVVGAAVGAGASTLIGQTLENVTGGQKRSAAEIVMNTVVDATIGAVVSKAVPVKVSGITSGRNSMNAVFKSGLTKLGNKTASKMSIKVVGKGIASGFVANLGLAFGMGVKSFISNSWQSYQKRQTATPTGTLYWCAP